MAAIDQRRFLIEQLQEMLDVAGVYVDNTDGSRTSFRGLAH
jgi:hypothetical protein